MWFRTAKENDESTTSRDLVPSKLADAVWDIVSKYKSTIPNFPQSETCDLLIVDRSIDQVKSIFTHSDSLSFKILLFEGHRCVESV